MKPIAQYRSVLRAGGETPLIHGITYAAIAHYLDAPRSSTRPRGVLDSWRARIDATTPTAAVMTMHIVTPGYVKLGWRHKSEPTRPFSWRLSRRTHYIVRWAERLGRNTERYIAPERDRAWVRQGETEALDIALSALRRLGSNKRRKHVSATRTRTADADRKRAERANMRARIEAIRGEQTAMRQTMTARAIASGMLTND